eukprot:GEMP01038696.1.p1 GENE.GEMP01038696.1~~GEMP01038696.1.p1  ORF type:complete len:465 (+),score=83.51 GEMP01038696.1:41-1396(+)
MWGRYIVFFFSAFVEAHANLAAEQQSSIWEPTVPANYSWDTTPTAPPSSARYTKLVARGCLACKNGTQIRFWDPTTWTQHFRARTRIKAYALSPSTTCQKETYISFPDNDDLRWDDVLVDLTVPKQAGLAVHIASNDCKRANLYLWPFHFEGTTAETDCANVWHAMYSETVYVPVENTDRKSPAGCYSKLTDGIPKPHYQNYYDAKKYIDFTQQYRAMCYIPLNIGDEVFTATDLTYAGGFTIAKGRKAVIQHMCTATPKDCEQFPDQVVDVVSEKDAASRMPQDGRKWTFAYNVTFPEYGTQKSFYAAILHLTTELPLRGERSLSYEGALDCHKLLGKESLLKPSEVSRCGGELFCGTQGVVNLMEDWLPCTSSWEEVDHRCRVHLTYDNLAAGFSSFGVSTTMTILAVFLMLSVAVITVCRRSCKRKKVRRVTRSTLIEQEMATASMAP